MRARLDFQLVLDAVLAHGFFCDVDWAEKIAPPASADDYAREAIFVICNSGMKHTIACGIFDRVMVALLSGRSAHDAFGHKGKAGAIDAIWRGRVISFQNYLDTPEADRLEYLAALPWIGGITKYHLAKNFGMQVAKPDVHLQRLAATYETTPQLLCEEIAQGCGLKVATVDTVLWRAAALGLLNTRTGEVR